MPLKKRRKTNPNNIELQEQEAINKCVSLLSQASSKDEYSIFGEHVANEIRLLKNAPDLQMKLKNAIQKNILEINMENEARQFAYLHPPKPIPSTTSQLLVVPNQTSTLSWGSQHLLQPVTVENAGSLMGDLVEASPGTTEEGNIVFIQNDNV